MNNNKTKNVISKQECSALRGIAILCIVIHNYCHLIPGAVCENEFSYLYENYLTFVNNLHWDTVFINLFTYWGHLGVPIFVMLSGYGLAKKYDKYTTLNKRQFAFYHYKKLIKPMFLGLIVYMIIVYFTQHKNEFHLFTIIKHITFAINFLPHPDILIIPGPYWYFGMTMQLYIIYILTIYKQPLKICLILSLVSLLLLFILKNEQELLVWIKYNSIGWQLPFCVGILLGKNKYNRNKKQNYIIFLVGMILIPIAESNYFSWLFIPIIIIYTAISFVSILPNSILLFFDKIGQVSLYIFVIHPLVRELTIDFARNGYSSFGLIIYLFLTGIVASLVNYISKEQLLTRIIKRHNLQ